MNADIVLVHVGPKETTAELRTAGARAWADTFVSSRVTRCGADKLVFPSDSCGFFVDGAAAFGLTFEHNVAYMTVRYNDPWRTKK